MRMFHESKAALVGLAFVFLVSWSSPRVARANDESSASDAASRPAKTAEPVKPPSGLTEREQWLLDRVEQLEKRVAELEAKQPKPSNESAAVVPPESFPATPTLLVPVARNHVVPSAASAGSVASSNPSALVSADVQPAPPIGPFPPAASSSSAQATEKGKPGTTVEQKAEPFAFADWTWLNGNPRTKEVPLDTKFFTPEIRADGSYIYDFNRQSFALTKYN